MNFCFDEDQRQLRAALRGYLARRSPFDVRTRTSREGDGLNRDLWRGLAEDLGILAAAIPERDSGLDRSAVDLMVIMEEAGANLMVEPLLECAIVAPALLATATEHQGTLAGIAKGIARPVLAWNEPSGRGSSFARQTTAIRQGSGWRLDGAKAVVVGAPWATTLLVTAATPEGQALFGIDPSEPGVSMTPYPLIDGRRAADVTLSGVELSGSALVLADEAAIARALDLATAMTGARALGVLRCLLDLTIDYTRQRRQFGKAIAEFQVLQHRMVDMYMHFEMATSAVYRAVLLLEASMEELSLAVSAMKVTVGEACRFVGQNAIQLHGGMGMTDEMVVSHYFRAATVIEQEYGSTAYHLDRFARLSAAKEA